MEVLVRMPSQPHSVAALNVPLDLLEVTMEGYGGQLEDSSAYATLWDGNRKVDGGLLGTVRISPLPDDSLCRFCFTNLHIGEIGSFKIRVTLLEKCTKVIQHIESNTIVVKADE